MERKNRIPKWKVLVLIVMVGAVAVGSGAGTFAYLSDEESVGATFETGSFLVNVTPSDGELESLDLDEEQRTNSSIEVCNAGTLPVRDVLVTGVNFRSEDIDDPETVAGALDVANVTYGEADVTSAALGSETGTLLDLAATVNDTRGGVSMSAPAGTSGLKSADNENGVSDTRCRTLVVTTKMNYSKLPDGYGETQIGVDLDIGARQQSPGE